MNLTGVSLIALGALVFDALALAQNADVPNATPVGELPHAVDAGWNGEKTCELLQENENVKAYRCTFAPGVGHERHFHNAHWGYVIEGGMMRTVDGKNGVREVTSATGAWWWSDGVEWHEALNIGDTTTSYVIVEPKGVEK